MTLSANPTLSHRRVHVQKDAAGNVIGAAVFLHAEAIAPYIFGDQEFLELEIEPRADGIFLRIEGDAI